MQQSEHWRTPFYFSLSGCSAGWPQINSFILLCFNFHICKKKKVRLISPAKKLFSSSYPGVKAQVERNSGYGSLGKCHSVTRFLGFTDCFHSQNFAKQSKMEQKSAQTGPDPKLVKWSEHSWAMLDRIFSQLSPFTDSKECFISGKWQKM